MLQCAAASCSIFQARAGSENLTDSQLDLISRILFFAHMLTRGVKGGREGRREGGRKKDTDGG